jgi:hypothetical protein
MPTRVEGEPAARIVIGCNLNLYLLQSIENGLDVRQGCAQVENAGSSAGVDTARREGDESYFLISYPFGESHRSGGDRSAGSDQTPPN